MIAVGASLPSFTFKVPTADGVRDRTTEEVFAGKTVALFAVPGAFTPTCSAKHLPSFVQHAAALKAKGVDQIACTAVNDAFVLAAWAKDQGVGEDVVMLADGGGAFAQALGLSVDLSTYGMGLRSQRYSMLVVDGKVTHLNVEQPGQYEVSSAEHMLGQLG